NQDSARGRISDWLCGLLCGLAFVMRYAALLLVIYAVIIIVCQSSRRPSMMAVRIAGFAAGVLPFIIPQLYLIHFSPTAEAIPDIFTVKGGMKAIVSRAAQGIRFLPSANVAVAW